MKPKDKLALIQINRRLRSIRRAAKDARVQPGWINYMRLAFNMTLKELAKRAGVSTATVAQAERNEAASRATVGTLKVMAKAMGCEFVYAFVPHTDIEKLIKEEALKKAKRILASADTHMTLEDQRVDGNFEKRVELLAEKLIEKGDVW